MKFMLTIAFGCLLTAPVYAEDKKEPSKKDEKVDKAKDKPKDDKKKDESTAKKYYDACVTLGGC